MAIAKGGGGGTPQYPFTYFPKGALDTWYAARNNQQNVPVNVMFWGDSFSMGFNDTQNNSWVTGGWNGRLKDKLTARGYTKTGEFVHPNWSGNSGATQQGPAPWTLDQTNLGSNAAFYAEQKSWSSRNGTPMSAPLATFTTPFAVTDLDIVYFDFQLAGNSFQWDIDGGAVNTVNLNATVIQKMIAVPQQTLGVHTLHFGNQTTDQALLLGGVAFYTTRASGIRYANFGFSGFASGQWATTAGWGGDMIKNIQGWRGGASESLKTGFGFPMQPHLAFLAMGLNDSARGSAYAHGPSGYESTLRRMCSAIRRGQRDASIVILGLCAPDANADMTSGQPPGATQTNWPRYLAAMHRVAVDYGCVFINFHAKWGQNVVAKGFVADGNFHPASAGHEDMAAHIAAML
jgi:hypothetical protein